MKRVSSPESGQRLLGDNVKGRTMTEDLVVRKVRWAPEKNTFFFETQPMSDGKLKVGGFNPRNELTLQEGREIAKKLTGIKLSEFQETACTLTGEAIGRRLDVD